MKTRVQRHTVDLSAYPDLVVIYLGMHVNTLTGIKTLFGLVPQITRAAADKPDGLLVHEPIFFSLRHVGLRQYWRDFDSLETWARSLPHKTWWQAFLRGSSGPASGMRPISCVAAWRLFTMMCRSPLALPPSLLPNPLTARCSLPASACISKGKQSLPPLSLRKNSPTFTSHNAFPVSQVRSKYSCCFVSESRFLLSLYEEDL